MNTFIQGGSQGSHLGPGSFLRKSKTGIKTGKYKSNIYFQNS